MKLLDAKTTGDLVRLLVFIVVQRVIVVRSERRR